MNAEGLQVDFTVVIESNNAFPQQPWEAVLWHNGHTEDQWAGLTLEPVVKQPDLVGISSPCSSPLAQIRCKIAISSESTVCRHYFTTRLPRPADGISIDFTLKYRTSSSDAWTWVNHNSRLTDGELLFQPAKLPGKLSDYLRDLSYDFDVVETASEVSGTLLWQLKASYIDKSRSEKSGKTLQNVPSLFSLACLRIGRTSHAGSLGRSFDNVKKEC